MPNLLLRAYDVETRLGTAHPGEWVAYHRGNLAKDRFPGNRYIVTKSPFDGEQIAELNKLANTMWGLYLSRKANLFQRRMGFDDYLYFVAVR